MTAKLRGIAELEDLDRVFSALADHTRRAILLVLHANGGQLTFDAIAARFDAPPPTAHEHLRTLAEAGLAHAASVTAR
jgi:DNA-binding transcriptional ArsR family regulator